jgi:TetR/AcrR family transcriptional regulator, regulator of mycofactocin system
MTDDEEAGPASYESGWDRRRRRIAEQIETVAIGLFAERGYNSVTLEQIAAEAGVSTRTLTRYFPLKEDLLLELPRRASRAMADALARTTLSPEPVADLWQLWGDLTVEYSTSLGQFFTWRRAATTAPEISARVMGEQSAALAPLLAAHFADAMGLSLDEDVRPRTLAAAVSAANAAVVDFWLQRGGTDALDDLFATALEGLHAQFASPSVKRLTRRSTATRPNTGAATGSKRAQ